MSPLEILKLVGFGTGAALHLYLCALLAIRQGLRPVERVILALGASVGAWHLGNFLSVVYEILGLNAWSWLRVGATELAYAALALMPPLLLHSHLRLWALVDAEAPRRLSKLSLALNYALLALLPLALRRLWLAGNVAPIDALKPFLIPFILWFILTLLVCAGIDLRIARRMEAPREKRFFERLASVLTGIGALFLITFVFEARNWGVPGRYLEAIAMLSSLVPTAILAYYIYSYRYLDIVIQRSFVYATFALLVLLAYLFGVRRISAALEARYHFQPEVVEGLLILALMFAAAPLRRFTEKKVRQLFSREVELYRDLVRQVGEAADSGDLTSFLAFVERRLADALELSRVAIVPARSAAAEAANLVALAEERHLTQIESPALLGRLSARACYVLWREGKVMGLMLAGFVPRELTAEKREVLAVLAGHVAVGIANGELIEEKVKLQKELDGRERLAALGQMAATIAHEIKNPLSAIKSITQVMTEDEAVNREYARDLELISGEADRLNRTVSQLLGFSRAGSIEGAPATLASVIETVLALLRAERDAGGTRVTLRLEADPTLHGRAATALKEAVTNLVLNALQASPGGNVEILSRVSAEEIFHIIVKDDGPGIPAGSRDKIFQPFFTTKLRGTGLGLAIVSRRVAEVEGALDVTSPVDGGRGAAFEIKVPLEKVEARLQLSGHSSS